ncbi:hypothetical protein DL93DRAFT_1918334 [Clavulina sp. PMI_390]|nr:hypothetical protein DL93DRAFT_1918334 [Clavulina sp. PMI_390]
MIAFLPIITLLASALLPAVGALPLSPKAGSVRERCNCPSDSDFGLGSSVDVGAVVNAVVNTGLGLGAGGHGSGASSPSPSASTDVSVDVWAWSNDLNVKVRAIVDKLDGNFDLKTGCNSIIAEINASIGLLAEIKVYSTDHLSDLVKLFALLYIDLVIAIYKYSSSSISACVDVLIQLDTCLKGLVVALNVHYDGFIGLCGNLIAGDGLNISSFTQISFKLCAALFFGASVN